MMKHFNLNWHTYDDHLKEMMQNLLDSNESTDVTLVCEDRTKFKAHKFVLNACSPVFQSIINDLPQRDSVIYLRGVLAPEMKPILQFMYLGQATLDQDRMIDFLNVAKSLEIKEISKDVEVDQDDPDSLNDKKYDETFEPNIGNLHEEDISDIPRNLEGEIEHKSIIVKSQGNEVGQLSCDRCDKHYTNKVSLYQHKQSIHEGVKFPCNKCAFTASKKSHLLRHIQVIHEGVKFSCDLCDFKATRKDRLNNHKKNAHN